MPPASNWSRRLRASRTRCDIERRRAAPAGVERHVRVSTGECAAGFRHAACRERRRRRSRPASPWSWSSRYRRQTSRDAKQIWRYAINRRKAATLYLETRTFACAVYRRRGKDTDAWITYPDEQPTIARPLGPAAGGRDGKSGGAARLIDAHAFGSDPRGNWARTSAVPIGDGHSRSSG
jgi:hypothetical protein